MNLSSAQKRAVIKLEQHAPYWCALPSRTGRVLVRLGIAEELIETTGAWKAIGYFGRKPYWDSAANTIYYYRLLKGVKNV